MSLPIEWPDKPGHDSAIPGPMSPRPLPRPGVLEIEAYVPGKSGAPGVAKVHKLSSNETPLGPSPKAIEAVRRAAGELELYPGRLGRGAARGDRARSYGLDPARIVCGAGSDELLDLLAQAYVGPGDEGMFTEHGFLVYQIAILAAGGTPVVAPEKDLTADVDAILAAVTPKHASIVFLANPNNPTGTYLPFDEVRRLHAGLPPHVLLVLDAAYAEYVRRNDYEAGLELVATAENVVMTRTFSKIYGLAGAAPRLDAIAPAACRRRAEPHPRALQRQRRRRSPPASRRLPTRRMSAAAVAHNERWLPWLTREIAALGLTVTPSVGNFVLIHFPTETGRSAEDADAFLTRARARSCARVGAYGLPNCLRMTIGTEEANRLVVAALRDFLRGRAGCLSASDRRGRAAVRAPGADRHRADRLVARARRAAAQPRRRDRRGRRRARRCCARRARARPRRRGDERPGARRRAAPTSSSCACRSAPTARSRRRCAGALEAGRDRHRRRLGQGRGGRARCSRICRRACISSRPSGRRHRAFRARRRLRRRCSTTAGAS